MFNVWVYGTFVYKFSEHCYCLLITIPNWHL